MISSCTRAKVHAPSNCESASHARVVASAARHPCRLRPQFTGRQHVVGKLAKHQGTCTERDGSALRHSVHPSKSCTSANEHVARRSCCARAATQARQVEHHYAMWPTCARGSNQ
eukprot:10679034-Alexandrium_andersonii.AAC.1